MANYKVKYLIPLFFLVFSKGYAQKNIENQQLLWLRYNLKLKLNDTYQINQEIEERTYWTPWRQHQLLFRTRLERSFNNNWKAAAGFAYLEQFLPNNPEIKNYTNVSELRPQLEVFNKQLLSNKLSLEHRYLADFRFFEQTDGSFDFGTVRARYRLELQYNFTKKITLKTFDEIFVNIGGDVVANVFEQNRIGASMQYMTTKNLGFEFGYFNSFQQRTTGVDFYNRNIIRFTVHQNINFKNKKSHV